MQYPGRNKYLILLFAALIYEAGAVHATVTLSLNRAVELAQYNDPWLVANQQSQYAIESRAVAAGALPDPKMSLGLANLPTDSFDFDQEAMTQFKVGLSQVFPRGDSRALQRKKLRLLSRQFPYQRENRLASVVVTVTGLWLDVFKAQQSIALIERDRALFEQLADVAHLSYSTALGRSRQQDVVRAQLELTRLEDRLTVLQQQRDEAQQRLSEWLSDQFSEHYGIDREPLANALSMAVDPVLPQLSVLTHDQPGSVMAASTQQLAQYFFRHPSVMAVDSRIEASGTDIELSAQKYKPEWGVNMSYGYRDSDPSGRDRADFLSVGVSFDLPLFTANRQDREYQASVATAESVKTEKWLLLRKMIAAFDVTRTRLLRLDERNTLYRELLLPQMQDQAEASLSAYTNDDGDFAEVMRANIALLNAQIDELGIAVDRQKSIAQLNYFLTVTAVDASKAIDQGDGGE